MEMHPRVSDDPVTCLQRLLDAAELLQHEGAIVMGVNVIRSDCERLVAGRERFAVTTEVSERNGARAEDLDHAGVSNQNLVEAGERLVGPTGSEQRQSAIEHNFGRLDHQ